MKNDVINFLRKIFPFLTVVFLWRLSMPFWNPGGISVLIPIFFCTFIRPTPWFMPFGLLFCFLLDYNLGALCYWTAIYCLCYALNGFQSFMRNPMQFMMQQNIPQDIANNPDKIIPHPILKKTSSTTG